MTAQPPVSVFWFRRDLRLEDNTGLHHALNSPYPVVPVFIFDQNILEKLPSIKDRRVHFIHHQLSSLQAQLQIKGSALKVIFDTPERSFHALMEEFNIQAVYCNEDYEPYARKRDDQITKILNEKGIPFYAFKDHVLAGTGEVLKPDGRPYTIFTPYKNKHLQWLSSHSLVNYDCSKPNFFAFQSRLPSMQDIGFQYTNTQFPSLNQWHVILEKYEELRDFPSLEGTSHLGIHLRFGTVSIRAVAQLALTASASFLSELIWRDFFQMILWHFPHIAEGASFKPAYDNIRWEINEDHFQLWQEGKTGYPLVDAGMRQLNATGFMHNRVRMVAASFLCKHLLLDWRWGEAYFAALLLDYDLASNNGNWQWAAGSGCDAAPYFRVFNPRAQQQKFDPQGAYVKRWVPEWGTDAYPKPVVEQHAARERCLQRYRDSLQFPMKD